MNKIDINNASYNEILSLPLSEQKNENIWIYTSQNEIYQISGQTIKENIMMKEFLDCRPK